MASGIGNGAICAVKIAAILNLLESPAVIHHRRDGTIGKLCGIHDVAKLIAAFPQDRGNVQFTLIVNDQIHAPHSLNLPGAALRVTTGDNDLGQGIERFLLQCFSDQITALEICAVCDGAGVDDIQVGRFVKRHNQYILTIELAYDGSRFIGIGFTAKCRDGYPGHLVLFSRNALMVGP